MEIFDSFPDIEEPELASKFVHSYLASKHEESLKPSLELFITGLSVDSSLHGKLKTIHKTRDVEALERFCVHFQRNSWRYDVQLESVNEVIHRIETAEKIFKVVRGELNHPAWTPRTDSSNADITSHIRNLELTVGINRDVPLLILFRLGSFQDDPILRARLGRIFSPLNHTFLLNTSGSGKTRLLFEGLCLHWGFYFTCGLDSSGLGSEDFSSAIDNVKRSRKWSNVILTSADVDYTSSLQNNRQIAYRSFSEALLARLLVFKTYLEACSQEGFCHKQRQRWLESQILPVLPFNDDPFSMINELDYDDLDDSVLDKAIENTLEDIQNIWEMPSGEFFYIVLDEANVASRMHDLAFADEYGHYPILKEIIRTLRKRMGHLPVKFVVAGTIIPQEHFQSAVGEWDDFRWCSDTGFL
ncbi:hypothetical protein BT96DRAFT_613106 [Gymnopus androsaceus JB14]|uniref:Uncharacterized protein n=1 Tax=Gymnopus androsaceus JB14 TaxID=1447944 RepID=A0A6A4HS69_9AGAR|nr:hypothetical protein BT96DRAFT_613106 [Gymnopus androsaceus JB14]